MHLSAWTDSWVDIPLNEDLFYEKLKERIDNSTVKKNVKDITLDVAGTH